MTLMSLYNLISFLGIFVLAAFAWLCSSNRKVVNWRATLENLWPIKASLIRL